MSEDQLFRIFPSSGVPIYRQIMDQIGHLLLSGHLRPGDRLPSVRAVATSLEVNPMTISKAYSQLESEGVLERVRGMGMQVKEAVHGESLARRLQQLEPAIIQLMTTAHQLQISRQDLIEALEPHLDQLHNKTENA